MSEEIWVGINDERVQLEGEALDEFIAQRDAYLEAKQKAEEVTLEQQQKRQDVLSKLGLNEEEAKLLFTTIF
jgi:hypothetical protein